MTEKEKMLAGLMYDPLNVQLTEERHRARLLFQRFNLLGETQKQERKTLLEELIPLQGSNLWIEPPFFCDYGYNIELGDSVFMNYNCCILDVMPVKIGNNVMLGPAVQIYTATHPLEAGPRKSGKEFAKPVSVGNDVWIGGGAVINPGVTIGNRVVVGSGAVVTKDIPDDVFVAGNPARIIKEIDNEKA